MLWMGGGYMAEHIRVFVWEMLPWFSGFLMVLNKMALNVLSLLNISGVKTLILEVNHIILVILCILNSYL